MSTSKAVCILCQEDQEITYNGRAMVLSAFVQRYRFTSLFLFFYWDQFCLLVFFLMNLNLYFFYLFIYRSSVLSQSRGKELTNNEDEDPLLTPSDLSCGTYTSSCGHVMHADCWQRLETFLITIFLFIYLFLISYLFFFPF